MMLKMGLEYKLLVKIFQFVCVFINMAHFRYFT